MPYSIKQIKKINNLTNDFYKKVTDSFSDTRQHEWPGWNLCIPYIKNVFSSNQKNKILDLACGNFRFEKFLYSQFIDWNYNVYAVDNTFFEDCPFENIKFIQKDIIGELIDDKLSFNNNKYDLIVAFGFFHHIPTYNLRKQFLLYLYNLLNNDGLLIISFWQFLYSDKILKKAIKATNNAKDKFSFDNLEEDDFFLNWQDREDVFRYCHNFSDKEISHLISDCNFVLEKSFNSDGKDNNLNKYLILKKRKVYL